MKGVPIDSNTEHKQQTAFVRRAPNFINKKYILGYLILIEISTLIALLCHWYFCSNSVLTNTAFRKAGYDLGSRDTPNTSWVYPLWNDWSWNGWKNLPLVPWTRMEIGVVSVGFVLSTLTWPLYMNGIGALKCLSPKKAVFMSSISVCVHLLCLLVSYYSFRANLWVSCGFFWCQRYGDVTYTDKGMKPWFGISLLFLHSGLFIVACRCLYVSFLKFNYNKITRNVNSHDQSSKLPVTWDTTINEKDKKNTLIKSSVIAIVLIPILTALCFFLPNLWEQFTPYDIYRVTRLSTVNNSNRADRVPLLPNLYIPWYTEMKTMIGGEEEFMEYAIPIYADVIIHYSFFIGLFILGILNKTVPFINSLLTRRIYVKFNLTKEKTVRIHPNLKTIVVLLMGGLYVTLFILYWVATHDYKSRSKGPEDGDYSDFDYLDFWFRGAGQFCSLFLTLAMVPISRRSVLLRILEYPWESCIKVHILSARLFLLAVVVHTVLYAVWIYKRYGNVLDLLPLLYNQYHPDHIAMSPPFKWTVYISFFALGVCSIKYFRRRYHKFFYVMHLSYMPLVVASLWHANSLWYYMALPGILMYIDVIGRAWSITRDNQIIDYTIYSHLESNRSIVELRLKYDDKSACRRSLGDWARIQIPYVSIFGYHPFTVLSGCGEEDLVFLISIQNGNTRWTGDTLALLDRAYHEEQIPITVEGFYGHRSALYNSMLSASVCNLVSGGIGYTPAASIIRTLVYDRMKNKNDTHVFKNMKRVNWILSVGDAPVLSSLAETCRIINQYDECTDEGVAKDLSIKIHMYGTTYKDLESISEGMASTSVVRFSSLPPNTATAHSSQCVHVPFNYNLHGHVSAASPVTSDSNVSGIGHSAYVPHSMSAFNLYNLPSQPVEADTTTSTTDKEKRSNPLFKERLNSSSAGVQHSSRKANGSTILTSFTSLDILHKMREGSSSSSSSSDSSVSDLSLYNYVQSGERCVKGHSSQRNPSTPISVADIDGNTLHNNVSKGIESKTAVVHEAASLIVGPHESHAPAYYVYKVLGRSWDMKSTCAGERMDAKALTGIHRESISNYPSSSAKDISVFHVCGPVALVDITTDVCEELNCDNLFKEKFDL